MEDTWLHKPIKKFLLGSFSSSPRPSAMIYFQPRIFLNMLLLRELQRDCHSDKNVWGTNCSTLSHLACWPAERNRDRPLHKGMSPGWVLCGWERPKLFRFQSRISLSALGLKVVDTHWDILTSCFSSEKTPYSQALFNSRPVQTHQYLAKGWHQDLASVQKYQTLRRDEIVRLPGTAENVLKGKHKDGKFTPLWCDDTWNWFLWKLELHL